MKVSIQVRTQSPIPLDIRLETDAPVLAIVGPNGSGKSTFLRALVGGVEAKVTLQVGGKTLSDKPVHRRRIGWVSQHGSLFPHLTVAKNVEYGAPGPADEWLSAFHLQSLAHRMPHTLSGGERQRVALARALASHPALLLLDEPMSALDAEARVSIRQVLLEHMSEHPIPTLWVTHDTRTLNALSPEVAVFDKGTCTRHHAWTELRSSPRPGFETAFCR